MLCGTVGKEFITSFYIPISSPLPPLHFVYHFFWGGGWLLIFSTEMEDRQKSSTLRNAPDQEDVLCMQTLFPGPLWARLKWTTGWVTECRKCLLLFFDTSQAALWGSALCKEQSRCLLLKNSRGTGASDTVIHQMPVLESFAPLLTSFLTEVISREANKKYWNTQKIPERLKGLSFPSKQLCSGPFFYSGGGSREKSCTSVKPTFLLHWAHLDTPNSMQMNCSQEKKKEIKNKVFPGFGNNSWRDLPQS